MYHLINRGKGKQRIFRKNADDAAFEQIMHETLRRTPTRLPGGCLMPNHWHLVIWLRRDGELSEFVRGLTHTQRWHAHDHRSGEGHVYQGRFKSFPIEMPSNWTAQVNAAQTAAQRDALQLAIKRSRPYGSPHWIEKTVKKLNLQWTLRPRGRPRVRPIKDSRPL